MFDMPTFGADFSGIGDIFNLNLEPSLIKCPNDSYVTRIYGNKNNNKITRICARCSDGTNNCNGTDNKSEAFT